MPSVSSQQSGAAPGGWKSALFWPPLTTVSTALRPNAYKWWKVHRGQSYSASH